MTLGVPVTPVAGVSTCAVFGFVGSESLRSGNQEPPGELYRPVIGSTGHHLSTCRWKVIDSVGKGSR